MKTPEDEAFDDIARRQGAWGGGFTAKRAAAADKLHWSDCAVHNGPAYPAGECDCGVAQKTEREALKLALEVMQINLTLLEKIDPYKGQEDLLSDSLELTHEAIASIEAALAQPAQDGKCKYCVDGCIACDARAQPAQEPVALDVTIEGDAAKLLADMLEPVLDEPTPIRLLVGNGNSGHGLYVAASEYQNEGAVLLVNTTPPKRERVLFPTMLRKMWSGGEVQAWLDENVNKEKNT
jgi:hypothetical protein